MAILNCGLNCLRYVGRIIAVVVVAIITALVIATLITEQLFAQGTQTIYEAPLTNVAAVPATSASIRNIGQSGHLLFLRLYNAPAQVCAAPQVVSVAFQASFDNAIWTSVGSTITTVPADTYGNLITTTTAQGAFPYIRVIITALDVVNCRADIRYSGTVGSQAVVSLASGSTGGGGTSTVTLPLYKAPTLVTTLFEYDTLLGDWLACKDVLNAVGEAGKVNFISVWLFLDSGFLNTMVPGESVYVRTRADGTAYTTMLPVFEGTVAIFENIDLTNTAKTLTTNYNILGGGNVTANILLPMQLDYTNSVQMQVCPSTVPLGSGQQGAFKFWVTVGRSIIQ